MLDEVAFAWNLFTNAFVRHNLCIWTKDQTKQAREMAQPPFTSSQVQRARAAKDFGFVDVIFLQDDWEVVDCMGSLSLMILVNSEILVIL